jgi:hypothetical protein
VRSKPKPSKASVSLVAFVVIQLVAACSMIAIAFANWISSQVASYRMSLAAPLLVLPVEGITASLAVLTLRRQRCQYLGAWIMVGLVRFVVAFQLPFVPWIYAGPWPPPPSPAFQISLASSAELVLGVLSLIWVYRLRSLFASS